MDERTRWWQEEQARLAQAPLEYVVLAAVSDLRAGLVMVKNALDLLNRGAAGPLTPTGAELVVMGQRGVARSEEVISTVLLGILLPRVQGDAAPPPPEHNG